MNKLQIALLRNAVFSGLSGMLMVAFRSSIAEAFALPDSGTVFAVIGGLLLFFTATIILEIVKQRPRWVMWIVIQDFLWVAGSAVLLALRPFGISTVGNIAIAVVAAIVAFMGYTQYTALEEEDRQDSLFV